MQRLRRELAVVEVSDLIAAGHAILDEAGIERIDYLEVVDASTLAPLKDAHQRAGPGAGRSTSRLGAAHRQRRHLTHRLPAALATHSRPWPDQESRRVGS